MVTAKKEAAEAEECQHSDGVIPMDDGAIPTDKGLYCEDCAYND